METETIESTEVVLDIGMLVDAIMSGNWVALLFILGPLVVTVANVITMMTPTNYDNKIGNMISMVLNWASLNVHWNANADDPDARDLYRTSNLPK